MKNYDIVVIGAGSAGLTVAYTGVGFGKKVLLIDKSKPGGECTWFGCVPSKALINEAEKVYNVRKYVPDFEYNTSEALVHVENVRQGVYALESPEKLQKDGIDYLQGEARFEDGHTLLVGEECIRGKKIFVCTGSAPFVPSIKGLKEVAYLTNETFFEQKCFPDSMIVLGGGAIGVEMAQALNRLGVHVELIEMLPNILYKEEPMLVKTLRQQLESEGVVIHTETKAIEVLSDAGDSIKVICEKEGRTLEVSGGSLFVAVGRSANVQGLDLEKASVEYDKYGIKVNDYMRTSNKNIYAVGDVAGPYMFSHMANVQGIAATISSILPINKRVDYKNVAWVTFTKPELARAGMTEEEARETHNDIRVYDYDFNDLDRARTKGETVEQLKVVLDKKGKVLGVSILADRAGEMIGEVQVLKRLDQNFAKMRDVIHPYPTYSEVFTKIGKKVSMDNILNHPLVKLIRK